MDTHHRVGPMPATASLLHRLPASVLVCMSLLTGAAVFGLGAFFASKAMPGRAARAACDRVVETLLTTRDPVELQRAAALVQAARCDVVRRLQMDR